MQKLTAFVLGLFLFMSPAMALDPVFKLLMGTTHSTPNWCNTEDAALQITSAMLTSEAEGNKVGREMFTTGLCIMSPPGYAPEFQPMEVIHEFVLNNHLHVIIKGRFLKPDGTLLDSDVYVMFAKVDPEKEL